VSGGAAKAASGQMTVMASGSPQDFAKVEDVFKAIAQKVYRLGDAPGAGSKVKMINQLLAGVHIAAAAEAMAMGIRSGADPAVLYEVISNSAGSSWMFQNRVPHILAGDYTPLSAVNIFVKDLGIVLDTAKKSAFPLPLTATAHQMFLTAAAAGRGGEDDSAVVKNFPGIELPQKKA
jgi:3-hydroxyisobutyrate dehydrogenase